MLIAVGIVLFITALFVSAAVFGPIGVWVVMAAGIAVGIFSFMPSRESSD